MTGSNDSIHQSRLPSLVHEVEGGGCTFQCSFHQGGSTSEMNTEMYMILPATLTAAPSASRFRVRVVHFRVHFIFHIIDWISV